MWILEIVSQSYVGIPLCVLLPPFSSLPLLPALYVAPEPLQESNPNVFHISSEPSLFSNSSRAGLREEEAPAGRGRREADSATPNSAGKVVRTESCKRTRGDMGQGQKGSSDKKEGRERGGSPAPEDGHKCRVCRFPLLVALLQLLLGVAVTVVAVLMLGVSPSLPARETPHWAGIIVSSVFTL